MNKTLKTVSLFAYSGMLILLNVLRLHQIATSAFLLAFVGWYISQRQPQKKWSRPLDFCYGFFAILAIANLYFGIENALK